MAGFLDEMLLVAVGVVVMVEEKSGGGDSGGGGSGGGGSCGGGSGDSGSGDSGSGGGGSGGRSSSHDREAYASVISGIKIPTGESGDWVGWREMRKHLKWWKMYFIGVSVLPMS